MKRVSLLLTTTLVVFSAAAQTPDENESIETLTEKERPSFTDADRPNEITVGSVSYSGIAVQGFKWKTLAELLSPLAPARYGHGEYNLVRDPIDRKPIGLRIFSIQF